MFGDGGVRLFSVHDCGYCFSRSLHWSACMMIMTFLYLSSLLQRLQLQASCARRWAGDRFHSGRTTLYHCFESEDFTNYCQTLSCEELFS